MIHPGMEIDGYVVEDELGRGGFGSVYLARDSVSGNPVAIKFLHPKSFHSREARQAFIDEMINQARLSTCRNIVKVVRSIRYTDRQGEHLGMVMEFVEGDPLDLFVERFGILPEFIAIPLFLQVLDGLEFAHNQNILHRDIKPANIMIGADGVVKLMDFGLAKTLEAGSGAAAESARAASLNYVAPERLRKETITTRTDIYSLGCTFYQALTGVPPHEIAEGSWSEAMDKHCKGEFKDIRDYYPGHSELLWALIAAMIAPHPGDRPPDCAAIRRVLEPMMAEIQVPAQAPPVFMAVIVAAQAKKAPAYSVPRTPQMTPAIQNDTQPQHEPEVAAAVEPSTAAAYAVKGEAKLSEGVGAFFGVMSLVLLFLMLLPWLEGYSSGGVSGFHVISREIAVKDDVSPIIWIAIGLIPFLFFVIRGASQSVERKDHFDNGPGAAMMVLLSAVYTTLFFNTMGNDDDIMVGAVAVLLLAIALLITAMSRLVSAENADAHLAWLFFMSFIGSGNERAMFLQVIFEQDENQPFILVLFLVGVALVFMAAKGKTDRALHRGLQLVLAIPAGVYIYRFMQEFLLEGEDRWDNFGNSHMLLLFISMLVFLRLFRMLKAEAVQVGNNGRMLA